MAAEWHTQLGTDYRWSPWKRSQARDCSGLRTAVSTQTSGLAVSSYFLEKIWTVGVKMTFMRESKFSWPAAAEHPGVISPSWSDTRGTGRARGSPRLPRTEFQPHLGQIRLDTHRHLNTNTANETAAFVPYSPPVSWSGTSTVITNRISQLETSGSSSLAPTFKWPPNRLEFNSWVALQSVFFAAPWHFWVWALGLPLS